MRVTNRCLQKLDGEMLPSRSGILSEARSIASTSLQERQSISLASYLQYPHFRSSRPKLFFKKDLLKNFAKLTVVSSGTRFSHEFYEILKRHIFLQNTSSGCFWHFRHSRFSILILYVINWQLRRECLVSFYGGAKNFIFTCIFLRIITVFIKI